AFLVKRDPHNAHRIPWSGWQHVEIAAAFAVLQHFFVVSKRWQFGDASHFPVTDRRGGMSRADRDWIRGDRLLGFENSEHVCFRVDLYGDMPWCTTFARS